MGVARARDLSNGTSVSLDTIQRMNSYFARHEVDKKGEGWGKDSAGYIAWLLWGGDAGWSWAKGILRDEEKKDKTTMSSYATSYASIIKQEKQEDGTLKVYGKATDDSLDIDNQICDEDWLKRAMPDWFQSGGNVREQHSQIAAGVATDYESKADGHYITALVVDPVSVKKVETGVLKGFSIGIRGPRVIRDTKAAGGRIVDGQIVEVSLVDRPANPNAKLMLAKAVESGELMAVSQVGVPSPADVAKQINKFNENHGEGGRFTSADGGDSGSSGSGGSGSSSPYEQDSYRHSQTLRTERVANSNMESHGRAMDAHLERTRSDVADRKERTARDEDKAKLDEASQHFSDAQSSVQQAESARAIGDYAGANRAMSDASRSYNLGHASFRSVTGSSHYLRDNFRYAASQYRAGSSIASRAITDRANIGSKSVDAVSLESMNNQTLKSDGSDAIDDATIQAYAEAVAAEVLADETLNEDVAVEDAVTEPVVSEEDTQAVELINEVKSILPTLVKYDQVTFERAREALSDLIIVEATEQKQGSDERESIKELLQSIKHLFHWYAGEVAEGEVASPDPSLVDDDADEIHLSATPDVECECKCDKCADSKGCDADLCKCDMTKSVTAELNLTTDESVVAIIVEKAVAQARTAVTEEIASLQSALKAEQEKAIQLQGDLDIAQKAVVAGGPKRSTITTKSNDSSELLIKSAEYLTKAKNTADSVLAQGYRELAKDLRKQAEKGN